MSDHSCDSSESLGDRLVNECGLEHLFEGPSLACNVLGYIDAPDGVQPGGVVAGRHGPRGVGHDRLQVKELCRRPSELRGIDQILG